MRITLLNKPIKPVKCAQHDGFWPASSTLTSMFNVIEREIGRWLTQRRAGEAGLLGREAGIAEAPQSLTVRSEAVDAEGVFNRRHTVDGGAVPPYVTWEGVPPSSVELVLAMEDMDAPIAKPFVHWIVYALDPKITMLNGTDHNAARFGKNGYGDARYRPPRPLRGHGPHRYCIGVFALNKRLEFSQSPNKRQIADAMRGHVIARGELVGIYERA